jgi:glycosyltransferase involved in cell wall biosynthesis
LRAFQAYYIGVERVAGLMLPADRCFPAISGGLAMGVRRIAFKAAGFAPAMESRIERLNARLIHAHFEDGGIDSMPLARRLDLPLITTCHGCDVTVRAEMRRGNVLKRRWHELKRRQLMESGSKFVAVSNHIRERMLERGYPAAQTETHYIGVDTKVFAPGHMARENGLVLFVGRLVEKKGCSHLIRAMAALRRTHPRARLAIIGDGPLRPSLEDLARSEGAICDFLGVQPPQRVKAMMDRACVLAAPSVTAANGDTEGLPLVVCEAQAMGLPVAGFHHAGIPEAVIDGETGLLCPEGRTEELSHNLACLLADSTLRQRFGAAARRLMHEKFNLSVQTAKLEALYDSAMIATETST